MAKSVTGSAAALFMSAFASETSTTQQIIPAVYINYHPENTAAKKDTPEAIRELASSIEANGLIHPLAVNHIGDNQYRLISGERRYRAVTEYLNWTEIPCTVYENLTPEMETLVLVSANLDTREYSAADKLELYIQADKALRAMKESGQYQGSIQRGVAAMLGVSDRQVRNYKAAVESAGDNGVRDVKNITDAAAATAAVKKAEVTSALYELTDAEVLMVLQKVYNTAKVESFYTTKVPITKEAVAFLKPYGGYSGRGGYTLPDGRSLSYSKSKANISVSIDGKPSIIKYIDADRVIRKGIAEGCWIMESDRSQKDINKQWDDLQEIREDMIQKEVDRTPPEDRPSAMFVSQNRSCLMQVGCLESINQAMTRLAMMIAEEQRYMMPNDFDCCIKQIERIAKDIKELQLEIELGSIITRGDAHDGNYTD